MTASLRELIDEVKVRHVRSASGARRYGLPIGSPIVDAPSTPPVGKPKLSAMMGKPSRTATPAASSGSGIPPKPVIPRMASRAAREKAEKEYTAWMKKYGPNAEVNAPAEKPGSSGVDPKAPAHIKDLAAKFHAMTFENTDSGELVKVTDLQDGDIAFGRCSDADSAFAIFADRESKLNTGYLEMNSPDGGMHYATVIEEPGGQQWVVDFTYRQFDPTSKWPLVVTMADYKRKYAGGGEDVEVTFDSSLRMDNLKTLSDVLEYKVRHIRTAAGARRYGLPIGSPISGHGGHHAPDVIHAIPSNTAPDPEPDDYRGVHKAPNRNSAAGAVNVEDAYPDLFKHPEYYVYDKKVSAETISQLRKIKAGGPDTEVTVYRAVPKKDHGVNPGDWVTLSKLYAQQHAAQSDNPAEDWPVVSQKVRAGDLFTDGDAIDEFGYDPTPPAPKNLTEVTKPTVQKRVGGKWKSVHADTIDELWKAIAGSSDGSRPKPSDLHPDKYVKGKFGGKRLKVGEVERRYRNGEEFDVTPYKPGEPQPDWIPGDHAGTEAESDQGTFLHEVPGTRRLVDSVYRIMDTQEWEQAQKRGYIQTDERMNLDNSEGTVFSVGSTGTFYAPPAGRSAVIVKVGTVGLAKFRVDKADSYIKTNDRVPLDQVQAVSSVVDVIGEDPEKQVTYKVRSEMKSLSAFVLESKMRHVRSTSGVRRFHLPIGSPIVAREGAPKPSRRHRKRVLRDLAGKPTPAGGKKPQTLRDVAAKPQELHGGGNPQGIHGRELMKTVLQLDHDDNSKIYASASGTQFYIVKGDGSIHKQTALGRLDPTSTPVDNEHINEKWFAEVDNYRHVASFKKGELTMHDATKVPRPKLDFDKKKYTASPERLSILDEYTNYLKGGHEVWGSDDPDYDNDPLRIDALITDIEDDASDSILGVWKLILNSQDPNHASMRAKAREEIDKQPARLEFLQHLKDIRDGNADLNDEGLPEGWENFKSPGRNFADLLNPVRKTDWKRDASSALSPGPRLTERKNFVLGIGQGTREDFEKILAKDKDYQGALAEADRLRGIKKDDKTVWQEQDQIRAEHYVNRMYRDRLKHYLHSLRPIGVDEATGAYLQAAPESRGAVHPNALSASQLANKGDEGSYDNWLDLFDQAQDYYPRDWLRKANVRQYNWAYADNGGWHSGSTANATPSTPYAASDDFSDDPTQNFTIAMLLQQQAHEVGYNGSFDKKSEDVALHEVGHTMELMIPGLTALEWAFLYDRAKNHTPERTGGVAGYISQRNYTSPMYPRSGLPPVDNVAPGSGTDATGYSDNFGRAYTGRVYHQFSGKLNPDLVRTLKSKYYGDEAGYNAALEQAKKSTSSNEKVFAGNSPYEIFTTGMQETFSNPVFGPDKSRDNQLMDFTIGSLLSLNWVWPDSGEQEPDIARAERKARLAQGTNAPAVKPAKVTPPAPVVTPPPVEPAKPPVAAAPKRLLKPVPGTTKVKTRDGFREVSGDDYGHFLIHGKSGDWTATHKASGLSVGTSSSKREVIDKINALQDMTDPHIPDYWAKEKPTDNPNNKIGQLELTDEQKRNGGSAAGGIFINRDVNQIATRLTMPGVDTERFNQAKVHYKAVTGKEWTKPQPASKARTGTTPTPTPPTPPAPSTSGSWSPEKLPALHSSFTFDGRTYVVTNSKPLQKYDAPWDQRGQGFVYAQPVGEAGATSRKFTPEELNFGGDFAPAKYVDTPNGVKGVRVQGNDWEQTWTDGNTGQKLGSYYYNRKGARDQRYEVRNEVGSNIQKVSSAQAAREALVKHANLVAAQRGK